MGKPYLNRFIKPILARLIEWQENKAAKKFDYICSATPFIRDRFLKINKNSIDINNYPILGELYNANSIKSNKFCYTGGITEERGIINIVKALKNIDTTISLAGPVDDEAYLEKMKNLKEWEKINYLGVVTRDKVGEIMSESIAGIVTFLPMPNHINAQPNKIFEYMSSSIPVIGSNFDLWKSIIVDNDCGLCVNPEIPDEIAKAMEYLQKNPEIAKKMGENGQKAVLEKYNWNIEEKKLFKVYKKILND
jgi:glycosyltransferase involved in cell wall biosynthesis